MYFEHNAAVTCRTGWKFDYTGKDLLPKAERLLRNFVLEEEAARKKAAALMTDMSVSANSDAVVEAKKNVERWARAAEEVRVFAHEFIRNPDRVYHLGLGDVVFFDYPGVELQGSGGE